MLVRGERCVIRRWRTRDAVSVVRYANNYNVSRYLRDRFPFPYTMAHARAFLAGAVGEEEGETKFAIEVDGEAVGGIGVIPGADIERFSAEIGYWLGEPFWGRGIATEAVRAVSQYAFESFDLCRLEAGVFEWNPASMRVLEKAGYSREGRTRLSVTKDGRTGDHVLYGLVRA
jgi:ribosomal-protein-alanine N-acetyltransferase